MGPAADVRGRAAELVGRHVTLRAHLVALILAVLLPALLFAGVAIGALVRQERAAFERGLLETVRVLSLAVDTELSRTIAALEVLAQSDSLTSGDARAFHHAARQIIAAQHVWTNIGLLTPSGEHLANTFAPFGTRLPPPRAPDIVVQTARERRPMVSDLLIGSLVHRPLIFVAVPVVRDDTVKYVLVTAIESQRWQSLLASRITDGRVGLLLDRRKTFIARTLNNADVVGRPAATSLVSRLGQSQEGVVHGPTVEGFMAYGAFYTSQVSGWTVDVFVPASVVDARLRRSVAIVSGGFVALLLSGVGLALVVARRIARPMTALTSAVQAVGRGEVPAEVQSPITEIRIASRALRAAAGLLTERMAREQEARATAEDALERLGWTQTRLSRLVKSNLIGVVFANAERITYANDAFLDMVGYTRENLETGGLDWRRMTPDEYREVNARAVGELLDRGECVPFEKEYYRRDGGRVPVLIGAASLSRQPLEWVGFVLDISKRRAAEAKIAALLESEQAARAASDAANRAKDEFLAMLGHELRNPLGAISSAVRVLDRIGKQEATAERARDVIRRQVEHLGRLVDDLLDVSRVMTGKIVLDREPLDLAAVARMHVDELTIAGHAREHTIEVDARPVWVRADAVRIEQIVANLVSNALRYTPPGGRVVVHVGPEDGHAVLRVADTGVGMGRELIARVFDLFVQGTQAPDRSHGGLGIGLTLVRRLVELHGGTIEALSDGPGRGSTFVVRLPAIAEPAPAARATGAAPTTVRRRVLVVEDNRDAREMLRQLLQLDGHTVWEAEDGPGALDLAARVDADVVLIDIGLPGIDGYEVARRLRVMAGGAARLLIALTGYGLPEDRERAAEAGFDAHLVKPVDPERLTELLARG